jgi:hypothetical protein
VGVERQRKWHGAFNAKIFSYRQKLMMPGDKRWSSGMRRHEIDTNKSDKDVAII